MKSGDNTRVVPLQPVELGHRLTGLGNTDVDTDGPECRECFFRDLHGPIVAGADHDQLRRVGQDGLEVIRCQAVPFPAPSPLLHMSGKNDHVRVLLAAVDAHTSECVVVDLHSSKAVGLCGVMVGPGPEQPSQSFNSECN